MEPDNAYLKKLLQPLKGKSGITSAEYFKMLQAQGIEIETPQGVADKKFETHFKCLISSGAITNDKNTRELNDFGIGFGCNGHITYWGSALIRLGTKKRSWLQWVLNKFGKIILGVIIAVITALLLKWFGLRPQ